jgi:hypothetical protein
MGDENTFSRKNYKYTDLIRLIYFVVNVLEFALETFIFQRGYHEVNAAREDCAWVAIEIARLREADSEERFFVEVDLYFGELALVPTRAPNFEARPLKKGPTLTLIISTMIG